MNIILLISILIIGLVLGLRFSQIKKEKKSSPEKIQPIENSYNPSHPTDIQDKRPIPSDATILEKEMLYDEELTLLLKMGQELSSSIELKDICKIIVANVKKVLNVEKCVLLLLNPKTDTLKVEYAFGLTEKQSQETEIKKGESISGWVAANNEMLFIKNIDDDYWIKVMNKEKYYTKSLISIPLAIRGKVFGVINVNNKISGSQFSDDDLRLLKGMVSQGSVAIQNARLYEELQDGYLRTITALAAALDAKDPYTRKHSENVTRYATAIARELGLSDLEVENIRQCGLLHDIGKIGIQDGILSSPRPLTEQERQQINGHPATGEEIISSLTFLQEVASYIRHHHERIDGKGYPDGKRGFQIELPARILAVCDAFDAMTSNRPYREALSVKEATAELKRCSGTQFDPEIANVFLRILEKNPDIVQKEV